MKKFIRVKTCNNLKEAQEVLSILFTKGYDNINIKQLAPNNVEVQVLLGTHDNLEDTLSELIDDGYPAVLIEA